MKATFYGHSCLGVEIAGRHLLFDPYIQGNALAAGINSDSIPVDYILVSHGHEDHVGDTIDLAKRTRATILTNWEIYLWLADQGVANVLPMNIGGTARFDFGRVKMVNAVHSSSLPDGSYGGHPAGFVVESDEGSFYFSGDTALTMDMQLIGESTPLKFSALCIGGCFTMDCQDAIRAADLLKCTQILGIHHNTFPPIKTDCALATMKFKAAGKVLHLPPIGESLMF